MTPEEAAAFLAEIGFEDVDHSNRSLTVHLIGTQQLLERWGCHVRVSRAGLIHSIYGTDYFRQQSVDPSERERISAMAGTEAERLAYLFGVMKRDSFYRNFTAADGPPMVVDRFTGSSIPLTEQELSDLAHIEVANRLEQQPHTRPQKRYFRRAELLAMCPRLNPAARAALDEAYDHPPDA